MGESPKKETVKLIQLDIGEADPNTSSLVAMEMKEHREAGYKSRRAPRKKSIDRIFGKMGTIDVENNVDVSKLKQFPRRSLAGPVALSALIGEDLPNIDSDEE